MTSHLSGNRQKDIWENTRPLGLHLCNLQETKKEKEDKKKKEEKKKGKDKLQAAERARTFLEAEFDEAMAAAQPKKDQVGNFTRLLYEHDYTFLQAPISTRRLPPRRPIRTRCAISGNYLYDCTLLSRSPPRRQRRPGNADSFA